MKDTTLSIAIINWNTCELTKNCIESILKNTKAIDYEIIVVDNGSTDNSVEVIEKKFSQVRLIKNSRNLGFAEPNQQALKVSHGKYFLLLNSDTIVHVDALEKMVDFLDTHPEAGAVTSKLLNLDGTTQYNMHRRTPTFLRLASGWIYKHYPRLKLKWAREFLMLDNKFDEIQTIEQAAGACIMIRKDIIEDIGGLFDIERFPLLHNDVDLCYRLYKNGFKIYLVPEAKITHLKGQSFKQIDFPIHKKEEAVSLFLFFRKHRKYPDYLLSKMAYLFLYSVVALWSLILLLIRRIDFPSFKDRLSVPLSILLERKIDL